MERKKSLQPWPKQVRNSIPWDCMVLHISVANCLNPGWKQFGCCDLLGRSSLQEDCWEWLTFQPGGSLMFSTLSSCTRTQNFAHYAVQRASPTLSYGSSPTPRGFNYCVVAIFRVNEETSSGETDWRNKMKWNEQWMDRENNRTTANQ